MRSLITALALPLASVAMAQAPSAGGTQPAGAEKKICKVDPEDTESRIKRRLCKTAAEWDELRKASKNGGRTRAQ